MYLDDTVIVPQHISRQAFCSAQFILFDSLFAFLLEYNVLGYILFSLYISTMFHWNCVRRMSIIKMVDIVLAISAMSRVTFVDVYRFTPYYQTVWNVSTASILIMFIINETLFYFQVSNTANTRNPSIYFHYFSLNHTKPNSKARELAYYRNVYTHMFFLHVLPPCVSAVCACRSIMETKQNNFQ